MSCIIIVSFGAACGDVTGTATTAAGSSSGATASSVGTTAEPDPTAGMPNSSTDATNTGDPSSGDPGGGDPGSGDPGSGDPGSGDPSSGTSGEPSDPAQSFFKPGTIAQLDLELSQQSLDALAGDAKSYVSGDLTVTLDGQTTVLPDIGVRLKGNGGSFRSLDGKASFLLNFDRFVDDQELFGMEKLALNNMVQDWSMESEVLSYALFRAGGVPACRAAHAVVTVNGEAYGLYTTVESVDNEEFLERWYGDDKGLLYEGAYGSDLTDELAESFDLDSGKDPGFMQLKALAAALDAITDPNDFVAEVDKVIDLDLYLTMAATEIYLGHWDGYVYTRNNFFIYRRSSDQRWVFMPWGVDEVLYSGLYPFGGQGRVSKMCVESLECRQMLAQKFEEVIARVDQLGLATTAQTLADTLRPAAEADPRKEYDMAAVDTMVAGNIEHLKNHGANLKAQLICVEPSNADFDGDGYSGCDLDCVDNDPKINPGVKEDCDLDDDNCNGVWDEDANCPQCVEHDLPAPQAGSAAFCFSDHSFAEAEADCVAQGGHLLSIHDLELQTFAATHALELRDREWWIGLNDIEAEDSFVWTDGTALDYTRWAGGEPDNNGDEDCVSLGLWGDGEWADMYCEVEPPYICRLP